MATYRYNVVIDVAINAQSAGAGKTQMASAFREMENAAQASSANISRAQAAAYAEQEKALSAHNARMSELATQRFNAEQERFNAQVNSNIAAKQREYDEIRRMTEEETRRNQQTAASNANANINGFYRQMGMSNNPADINAQTKSQAAYNSKLLNMASKDIAQAEANIDKVLNGQKIADSNRQLAQLTKTTSESTGALGMWGQAFKGAFIGAIAGMTFSTIIGGITSLVTTIKDAAVQSVVLAGNFEQSTNSIAVFAGSTRLAKEELSALDDAARNTPGLELQGAEKGYQQLRALNFEAKLSKDLIIGIGKERLISGTDEANVQRVIVNLTQLSASTARAGMDIREIIHAIPTMRAAFIDAFGTVEPTKIKNLIDTNAPEFFRKLAESMNKTEIAAPGLNASFTSLMNAFLEAGRAFGQPFLEPITGDVQDMTKYLNENALRWRHWGQEASDAVQGVIDMIKGLDDLTGGALPGGSDARNTAIGIGLRGAAVFATAGISEAVILAGEREKAIREQATKARQDAKFNAFGNENPAFMKEFGRSKGTYTDKYGSFDMAYTVDFGGPQSDKEINRRNAAAEQQKTDLSKKAMDERVKVIQEGTESQVAAVKNGLNVELAIRDAHLRNTTAEERTYQKEISGMKTDAIQREIDLQTKSFQAELDAAKNDDNKRVEISTKANTVLGGLRSQLSVEIANAAKADAEIERKMLNEIRQAHIEFNSTIMGQWQQLDDARASDIRDMISMTQTGYDDLINLTNQSFEDQTAAIYRNSRLQLEDVTLTAEQRLNIEAQTNGKLLNLAEQNRQKIGEINKQKLNDLTTQINEMFSNISESRGISTNVFQTIFDQFKPDVMFGKNFPIAQINKMFGTNGQLNGSQTDKDVSGVMAGTTSFYDAQAHALEKIQLLEKDALQSQLDLNTSLKEIEEARVKNAMRMQVLQLQMTQSTYIQQKAYAEMNHADETTIATYTNLISQVESQMQGINSDLGAIEDGTKAITTAETRRLDASSGIVRKKQDETAVNQEIAKQNLKEQTDVERIRQTYDDILAGKRNAVITSYQELTLNQQRRDAAVEYQVQEVTMNDAKLVNLMRETQMMKDVTELRNQELQSVFAIDKAQLQINQKLVYSKNQSDAKVAEFLANQKGLTEIVSDAKINMLTTAYSGLDAVAGRLAKSFGAAKDMVQGLISSLLKLALNWVFQKYFGIGGGSGGSGQGAGGGFSLPNFNLGSGGSQQGGGIGPLFSGSQGGGIFNFGGGGGASQATIGTPGFSGTLGSSQSLPDLMTPSIGIGGTRGGGQSALAGLFSPQGLASAAATMGVSAAVALAMYSLTTTSPIKGLLTGGLVGLAAGFYNRTKLRRKEEIARNTAMLDAFAALDKLIENVRNDKIDGASALDQADGIRKNYVDSMSQLKDKRTRETALRDVSRIDQKISDLRSAVGEQVARKERLELMVPTFAAGGPVSMGFQTGPGTSTSDSMMGYFPVAGTNARYSRSEYILDAETTSNIGVHQLDQLRASKGRTYSAMRAKMPMANAYAGGGAPTAPASVTGSTSESGSNPMTLELSLNVGLSTESFIQVISSAITNGNGSRDQLQSIVTELKNQGNNELTQVIAKEVAKLLK